MHRRLHCTTVPIRMALIPAQAQPTREGYLRFLVESKAVYDVLEQVVKVGTVTELELTAGACVHRSCHL